MKPPGELAIGGGLRMGGATNGRGLVRFMPIGMEVGVLATGVVCVEMR